MDTRNSQKKSPRSSAKSKQETTSAPRTPEVDFEQANYLDRSFDHVARVRAAKEAAQREMESFGDVSEYDITIIQGQMKEESGSQAELDFRDNGAITAKEKA